VDVNVHPAKDEVRIADGRGVQDFVQRTIRELLLSERSIPKLRFPGTGSTQNRYFALEEPSLASDPAPASVSDLLVSTYGGDQQSLDSVDIKSLLDTETKNIETIDQYRDNPPLVYDNELQTSNRGGQFRLNIPSLKVLASLFASYLLADDGENLYLIDQHAAHERVNFERFLQNAAQGQDFSQELLTPYLFIPPPGALTVLRERPETFARFGFELEEFGEGVWRASSFPAFLRFAESEAFLAELLAAAAEGDFSLDAPENIAHTERLVMRACRAAVKAGDLLNDAEISTLLQDLSTCENPYTCPHGRPVFLKLSKSDIERLFKRAGVPA
jgi:DNA mismatch repair protein MutL